MKKRSDIQRICEKKLPNTKARYTRYRHLKSMPKGYWMNTLPNLDTFFAMLEFFVSNFRPFPCKRRIGVAIRRVQNDSTTFRRSSRPQDPQSPIKKKMEKISIES